MFDKNKFAQIIKNIKDTYNSQEEFSKKSGIGRTYLSQYMNMKLDNPPKPTILKKLANASNDITSYDELMQVCGYIYVTELNTSSFGINLEYWRMIFGNIEKIELTQKGSTFFASVLDTILQKASKSKNVFFKVDLNPINFIPVTNNTEELVEYTKIFSFIICSLLSNGTIYVNDLDKKDLLDKIQKLLDDIPNDYKDTQKISNFRYASHNGINTDGLSKEDIDEINRFVEFIKNKKKNESK